MRHLLARGALLVIQLEDNQMRFEYSAVDPTNGGDFSDEKSDDLVAEYHRWRKNYSMKTDEATWREAINRRGASQGDRFRASLAAIDVMLSKSSAIVLLRLLDGPHEYAQPIKDGDVAIVWSGGVHDGGFHVKFQDRARTAAPVVSACIAWLDAHKVLAQRFLRTDSSTTDQDDGSPLAYGRVFRSLFQQALVR